MELTLENYNLIISEEAKEDIANYVDHIIYTYKAPQTAKKHYLGLRAVLENIQKIPKAYTVRNHSSLVQYGLNVRRANYKKMSIIFTINGNLVVVHRVLAASMITGL